MQPGIREFDMLIGAGMDHGFGFKVEFHISFFINTRRLCYVAWWGHWWSHVTAPTYCAPPLCHCHLRAAGTLGYGTCFHLIISMSCKRLWAIGCLRWSPSMVRGMYDASASLLHYCMPPTAMPVWEPHTTDTGLSSIYRYIDNIIRAQESGVYWRRGV